MRRSVPALVLALLVAVLVVVPAAAITGGQPDGNRHPYVGIVFNVNNFCSGTLLSPTVFLTAGHCTEGFVANETYVSFEPEPVPNPDLTEPWFFTDNAYLVAEVHTYPDFCISCAPGLPGFDTYDVGVLILAEPVAGITTFGVLPEAGTVADLDQGDGLTAVGYGIQGFDRGGGPPRPSALGTRYFATVEFVNVRNRIGDMFIKVRGNKGGQCFGDSGGPLFAPDQVTILGVTAFGSNGVCAGVGYSQRIDLPEVLAWIEGFL